MSAEDELSELLFFDTFSHEINEELNLDLVQFPKPVYITELRIIPLGAKVEAHFPGGVRLGATNPSSFQIDFFINDLTKPSASTFEKLGSFMYNQNDCINMVCDTVAAAGTSSSIPTDGLVLRGWYTTITLAVYGTLTKNVMEQIASPPAAETLMEEVEKLEPVVDPVIQDVPDQLASGYAGDREAEYAAVPPKDPRLEGGAEWEDLNAMERARDLEWEKVTRSRRSPGGRRKSERSYSRSSSRDRNAVRDWSRSPESYRYARRLSRSSAQYENRRDSSYEKRTSSDDTRKRPRTPPLGDVLSPVYTNSSRRPRSPDQHVVVSQLPSDEEHRNMYSNKQLLRDDDNSKTVQSPTSTTGTPLESPAGLLDEDTTPLEEFEPILSDDELVGDDADTFDYDFEEYEEVQKAFNPTELQQFASDLEAKKVEKDFEAIAKILNKMKTHNGGHIITAVSFDSGLSRDDKESWVHSMEQMNAGLSQICRYQRAVTAAGIEALIKDHRATLINWLTISLDYDCAMGQVTYKVRHIKAGLRFAELICCYEQVAHLILVEEKIDVFRQLFDLYNRQFMAMSLQLMILKTMASILDTRTAVELSIMRDKSHYQTLLEMIEANPKIYLKFALKAIVKKFNLYETIETVKEAATDICVHKDGSKVPLLNACLSELYTVFVWDKLGLSHSKHFVPVSKKIEIRMDEMAIRSVAHTFDSYFAIHSFVETMALLIANRNAGLGLVTNKLVMDMLKAVLRNSMGFLHLTSRLDVMITIVKSLLLTDSPIEDEWRIDNHNEWRQLGLEIAYKMQSKYHLDAIQSLTDEFEIVDHLTALFSMTSPQMGRRNDVIETICMNDNLTPILNLIETEKEKTQSEDGSAKAKSPILGYLVDVLDVVMRHGNNMQCLQESAGKRILSLVKSYDSFDSNVSAMLQELAIYLKPLESPKSVFSYEDASPLVELMKRSFEFFATFPGDLIMCLRIARYMAIPNYEEYQEYDVTEEGASDADNDGQRGEYKELRYKMFVVQFFAADGLATLVAILEKMVAHFQQQPKMHASSLVGGQGVLVLQIILPTVQVLRRVLAAVIEARHVNFKDLTAITPLLHIYNLCHTIPATALAYADAQKAQLEIVRILLCYTQPMPPGGVDNESVMKSLWSQMIGEVIKFTVYSPSSFIAGMTILSELLPLPLPVPTVVEQPPPTDQEIQRIITERQLWSAHLHPQTNAIVELIQTIAPTSYPPLVLLLARVSLQMSDLGPNVSLVVAKALLDLFVAQPLTTVNSCLATGIHLRLMNFIGNLVGHASVKVSVLSLLGPKLMEVLATILMTDSSDPVHCQTQESVHGMLQSLLDCEISFYAHNNTSLPTGMSKELALACVIPAMEHLVTITNVCLDHLLMDGLMNVLPALRTLMLLTEHDVTIRVLRNAMERRRLRMPVTLRRLVANFKENGDAHRGTVAALMEFLRLLINVIDDGTTTTSSADLPIPSRTITLTGHELGVVLNYWADATTTTTTSPSSTGNNTGDQDMEVDKSEIAATAITTAATAEKKEVGVDGDSEAIANPKEASERVHPLLELRDFLVENRGEANDPLLENCTDIVTYLEAARKADTIGGGATSLMPIMTKNEQDYQLPQAEGIVAQYAARQVFAVIQSGQDERLSVNYWLNAPNYDEDVGEMDQVPCDLTEIVKSCLPSDTNLVADCKRLLNLSVSPQARDRAIAAPCFRTRRIEMDPLAAGREKKIFVTPMRGRGFARTPPSRGDLFRSRPPNTSRPPSLHVDDFLALEGCGAQPTGPTGYNKMPREMMGMRGGRGRGRGGSFQGVDKGRVATSGLYRQSIPSWSQASPSPAAQTDGTQPPTTHFRTATTTPQYGNDAHHYHRDNHFGGVHPRGRFGRGFYRNRNYPR